MTDASIFIFVLAIAAAVGVIGVCIEVASISRKLAALNEGIAHLIAMNVLNMENSSVINDNIIRLMEYLSDDVEEEVEECDEDDEDVKAFTTSAPKDPEDAIPDVASPPKDIIKWAQNILTSQSK